VLEIDSPRELSRLTRDRIHFWLCGQDRPHLFVQGQDRKQIDGGSASRDDSGKRDIESGHEAQEFAGRQFRAAVDLQREDHQRAHHGKDCVEHIEPVAEDTEPELFVPLPAE
jgi:hypothetical protein